MSAGKKFGHRPDRQLESRNLTLFDALTPEPSEISREYIISRPSLRAAMRLAQDVSGLEDKQLADGLGIDVAQWSRIKTGSGHFPTDKIDRFMELVGNDIPLIWLAHRRGYELKPLLSTLEQQLAAERAARLEAERELEIIKRFVRETRG